LLKKAKGGENSELRTQNSELNKLRINGKNQESDLINPNNL
jgi:hypothetical protein